jgi:hypothetical protein
MTNKKVSTKVKPEELIGDIIYPVKLTPAQRKEANRQLSEARKKTQEEMSESDRLVSKLFQLKFQLEDYIENKE